MGALKPRDRFGDLEVGREAKYVVVRIPTAQQHERIVFTLSNEEAADLAQQLAAAVASVNPPGMTGAVTTVVDNSGASHRRDDALHHTSGH